MKVQNIRNIAIIAPAFAKASAGKHVLI
jgi:hypothetical protein